MTFSITQRITSLSVLCAFLGATAVAPQARASSITPEEIVSRFFDQGEEGPLSALLQKTGASIEGADGKAISLVEALQAKPSTGILVSSSLASGHRMSVHIRSVSRSLSGTNLHMAFLMDGKSRATRTVFLEAGKSAEALSLSLRRSFAALQGDATHQLQSEGNGNWMGDTGEKIWKGIAYAILIGGGILLIAMGIKELASGDPSDPQSTGGAFARLRRAFSGDSSFLGGVATAAGSGVSLTKGILFILLGGTGVIAGVTGIVNGFQD